jgi:hypothetical protein
MKILIAGLALVASLAFAKDDHTPRHGGIVAEHKLMDLELVAKPDVLRLYLRGHDGKPLDVSKATAKLTLLSGREKQEVELKPAGDALEAKGSFQVGKGAKAVVVVKGVGKGDATGRFTLK